MMSVAMLVLSAFTFVELNCENLFDCQHDSLKDDVEFLPDGLYRWTPKRYWRKLNNIGHALLACGELDAGENDVRKRKNRMPRNEMAKGWRLPDMVALCEVENDSVMRDLTKRSLLRGARYEYVMTSSPDKRGIDVALMYSPFTFKLVAQRAVRVKPVDGMRPTRDVLYVSGVVPTGDTLHVLVVHFPSRRGGEVYSRPFRRAAARTVMSVVDSVKACSQDARIIVAGDFNDYSTSESVAMICSRGLYDVSDGAVGKNGARGTYRYQGEWGSLDHILVSGSLVNSVAECRVFDAPFLIEDDRKYGGVKPRRNYLGPRYLDGFSDHLPLVMVCNF